MFSTHLFSHKYDIDLIIYALTSSKQKNFTLHTEEGFLTHKNEGNVLCKTFVENEKIKQERLVNGKESQNPEKGFSLSPLPLSFIEEIKQTVQQSHLTNTQKNTTLNFLQNTKKLEDLRNFFEQGVEGAFLREQIKKEALEWLDLNNLIPPSMGNIHQLKTSSSTKNIKIILEDNSKTE